MQNISIDQFYRKINKKILLVGAYLDDPELYNVIRGARLKPASIFGNNFKWSTILEKLWVDEFNNSLEIKKRKAKIILNSGQFQKTTTDIYKNSTLDFIIHNSRSVCIGIKDNQESWIVLRGSDDYLRCYWLHNNQITITSPLIVGIEVLKWLYREPPKLWAQGRVNSELKNMKHIEWIVAKLPLSHVFESKLTQQLRNIFLNVKS